MSQPTPAINSHDAVVVRAGQAETVGHRQPPCAGSAELFFLHQRNAQGRKGTSRKGTR
jgi:hypothetical protein